MAKLAKIGSNRPMTTDEQRRLIARVNLIGADGDDSSYFGDVEGGDYTEIKPDGKVRRVGDAMAYKAIKFDLATANLHTSADKVAFNYDDNTVDFSASGEFTDEKDRVNANMVIGHEFNVGSAIRFIPYIKWFQTIDNETSVTDESVTAPADMLSTELLHVPLYGTVVVQDSSDSTTYTENTDYAIDYVTGQIQNLGTTITSGVTLHVDYDYIDGEVDTPALVMSMRHRVQKNGEVKTTEWKAVTSEADSDGL